VQIKDMIDKEQRQQSIEMEKAMKLKELGWDGPSGGSFLPRIKQQAAARALQLKDVERQASRNTSPSGVRDRPSSVESVIDRLGVDQKIELSREGRIRKSGVGVEEARELVLQIKSRQQRGKNKKKLSAVERRLLASPLVDAFHGKSRSNSRNSHLRNSRITDDWYQLEEGWYSMPPLALFEDDEEVVIDQKEFYEITETVFE
jgi:hypothetical protein